MSLERFPWTDDMREISGMGGGYENACRKMVSAGMAWLVDHKDGQKPEMGTYEGITGIAFARNDAGVSFSDAVGKAVEDCTGAMHQFSCAHAKKAFEMGWPAYQEFMRELKRKEAANGG